MNLKDTNKVGEGPRWYPEDLAYHYMYHLYENYIL